MHLLGLALAPVLFLIPHVATAPTEDPVRVVLFEFAGCVSATSIKEGDVEVDPLPKILGLANQQCVKAPSKLPPLPYVSFISYSTASKPAGTTCFTTVFSDDACTSTNSIDTVEVLEPNEAPCNEVVPPALNLLPFGVKSAKVVCTA